MFTKNPLVALAETKLPELKAVVYHTEGLSPYSLNTSVSLTLKKEWSREIVSAPLAFVVSMYVTGRSSPIIGIHEVIGELSNHNKTDETDGIRSITRQWGIQGNPGRTYISLLDAIESDPLKAIGQIARSYIEAWYRNEYADFQARILGPIEAMALATKSLRNSFLIYDETAALRNKHNANGLDINHPTWRSV